MPRKHHPHSGRWATRGFFEGPPCSVRRCPIWPEGLCRDPPRRVLWLGRGRHRRCKPQRRAPGERIERFREKSHCGCTAPQRRSVHSIPKAGRVSVWAHPRIRQKYPALDIRFLPISFDPGRLRVPALVVPPCLALPTPSVSHCSLSPLFCHRFVGLDPFVDPRCPAPLGRVQ